MRPWRRRFADEVPCLRARGRCGDTGRRECVVMAIEVAREERTVVSRARARTGRIDPPRVRGRRSRRDEPSRRAARDPTSADADGRLEPLGVADLVPRIVGSVFSQVSGGDRGISTVTFRAGPSRCAPCPRDPGSTWIDTSSAPGGRAAGVAIRSPRASCAGSSAFRPGCSTSAPAGRGPSPPRARDGGRSALRPAC